MKDFPIFLLPKGKIMMTAKIDGNEIKLLSKTLFPSNKRYDIAKNGFTVCLDTEKKIIITGIIYENGDVKNVNVIPFPNMISPKSIRIVNDNIILGGGDNSLAPMVLYSISGKDFIPIEVPISNFQCTIDDLLLDNNRIITINRYRNALMTPDFLVEYNLSNSDYPNLIDYHGIQNAIISNTSYKGVINEKYIVLLFSVNKRKVVKILKKGNYDKHLLLFQKERISSKKYYWKDIYIPKNRDYLLLPSNFYGIGVFKITFPCLNKTIIEHDDKVRYYNKWDKKVTKLISVPNNENQIVVILEEENNGNIFYSYSLENFDEIYQNATEAILIKDDSMKISIFPVGVKEIIKYYNNGKIKFKGGYVNDGLHGTNEWYYENGQLKAKVNYINGKRHGKSINYYENGLLKFKGNFENDDRQGVFEWYYNNGKLKRKESYIYNFLQGISIRFYENEKLKLKGNYKCNKPHGNFEEYYKNEKLKFKGNFDNGKRQGVFEWYYKNGQLKAKVNFIDDKLNGKAVQYYINGQLHFNGNFVNNKLEGPIKIYYENGQLKEKRVLVDGVINGNFEIYNKKGKIELKGNYSQKNNFGNVIWFYENNQIRMISNFIVCAENKIEIYLREFFEWYYENGQLKIKGKYNKFNNIEGLYEIYYKNGQLRYKGNFKNGLLNGLQISYYNNEQIKFKGNYKNDIMIGIFESYYKNGQLQFKGNIKDGKIDGAFVIYNKNGHQIFKGNLKEDYLNGNNDSYPEDGKLIEDKDKFQVANYVNQIKKMISKHFFNKNGKLKELQTVDDLDFQSVINKLSKMPFKRYYLSDNGSFDVPPDFFNFNIKNNPYYNNHLDMDQQSQEFWDNL